MSQVMRFNSVAVFGFLNRINRSDRKKEAQINQKSRSNGLAFFENFSQSMNNQWMKLEALAILGFLKRMNSSGLALKRPIWFQILKKNGLLLQLVEYTVASVYTSNSSMFFAITKDPWWIKTWYLTLKRSLAFWRGLMIRIVEMSHKNPKMQI